MDEFNVKDASHGLVSIVSAVENMATECSGESTAKRMLEDAHNLVCSWTPEERNQVIDFLSRAEHVPDGSGHTAGLKFFNEIYVPFNDCPKK